MSIIIEVDEMTAALALRYRRWRKQHQQQPTQESVALLKEERRILAEHLDSLLPDNAVLEAMLHTDDAQP